MAVRRLKTRAQFQAVLAGATVSRTAHFALHRLDPGAAPSAAAPPADGGCALFPAGAAPDAWLGAMTPKRWARRAVTRNSIKRQIYAMSDVFHDRLQGAAHVVRLRAAFDRAQFVSATSAPLKSAVRAELQQLFERLRAPAPQQVPG